jgi:hypothetical protein
MLSLKGASQKGSGVPPQAFASQLLNLPGELLDQIVDKVTRPFQTWSAVSSPYLAGRNLLQDRSVMSPIPCLQTLQGPRTGIAVFFHQPGPKPKVSTTRGILSRIASG